MLPIFYFIDNSKNDYFFMEETNTQNENMNDPVEKTSASGSKKSKILVIAVLVVLAAIAAVFAFTGSSVNDENLPVNENGDVTGEQATPSAEPGDTTEDGAMMEEGTSVDSAQGEVKVFEISGENFKFSLGEIKVKEGDRVKIVFTNTGGFHDWVIDEFDVSTPQIETGETVEVEFVADKKGTFEYYCSVGSHRQLGMRGNLVVE
ncbi:MAG: hypothetical protein COV29_03315 [Candidatus Yanofskybacteria bacterium CG10_big_fil_rev_8_21_14_0_10_36_16]|uniref:EfeO-type cupredoxin-like domain-containing protein n=1 Tax=Candidatus Yanofskybacteria bacterium CG10_big_fil_rev_8_21_14_0_10_36_16 TaxID=1975096 RepID=A0A2J0Q704_9BACT|nr:MAG: hypothetical protein COV29_03315 [Candidatus Yanofskybacteria bacterium CG10_big_fil_rev_8_21_14_0_10_36_16]